MSDKTEGLTVCVKVNTAQKAVKIQQKLQCRSPNSYALPAPCAVPILKAAMYNKMAICHGTSIQNLMCMLRECALGRAVR